MASQNTPSVMQPMNGPERRLSPRKTVERFAYINIEPSNGGSVLNVSEGGLCFHSIAPIQRNGTIRFWFREHDRRIEVEGHLVWTDKAQKTAGLRFTNLPEEAREPMRSWTSLPTPVASEQLSPLSTLLRRANPALGISHPHAKSGSNGSEAPAVVSRDPKTQPPFSAFSGGLVTGLLLSALLFAPFLFRSYKRQLGESLIFWGERFAARPHSQMQSATPAASAISPLEQATIAATSQESPDVPNRLAVPPLEQAVASAPKASSPKQESPAPKKMVETSRTVVSAPGPLPGLPSGKLLPEPAKKNAEPRPEQVASATPTPAKSTPTAAVAPKASSAIATAAMATNLRSRCHPLRLQLVPLPFPPKPHRFPHPNQRTVVTLLLRMPVQRTRTRVSRRTSK